MKILFVTASVLITASAANATESAYPIQSVHTTPPVECSLSGNGVRVKVSAREFGRGEYQCGQYSPVYCKFGVYLYESRENSGNERLPMLELSIDYDGRNRSVRVKPSAFVENFLKGNPFIRVGFRSSLNSEFTLEQGNISKKVPLLNLDTENNLKIEEANLTCEFKK